MHEFNEHHPEFKGFSAFYDKEIFPVLSAGEAERLQGLKKLKTWLPPIVFGVIATCAVIWYLGAHIFFYFFAGIAGLMIGLGVYHVAFDKLTVQTKDTLMGGVCRFLGWDYTAAIDTARNLQAFVDLHLLTRNYDRMSLEDLVSGQAHGARFDLYEAHLEEKVRRNKKTSWVTRFRGQLITIDFDQKFLGRTIVLRDQGWFNAKKKTDMKRVGLVDPVFEKIFEAYGTDQVEARYLLTPTFMQRLVDLENSVDGRNIRFAFSDGQLLIAVETANRYEVGSMFKPLIDPERAQNILDEIGAIYGVVDGVMER